MRRLAFLLPLLMACKATPHAPSQAPADKPNFIVINIDDLGYGDIGPFGSELHRTPNIDRMAREGRMLTSFYGAPVCSPSRSALMTGCYPKRVLPIPHVLFPANAVGLNPEENTVAEFLKAMGYATGMVGKWHLGDQPDFLPTRQGFDSYFGLPYSNDMGPVEDGIKNSFGEPARKRGKGKGQPPLPLLRNETILRRIRPDSHVQLVKWYTEEALKFIRAHRKGPFFLYLPHNAVHWPLYPGDAFRGKSKHGLYGDWVEEVDWSVGQVLDTVRELGLEKNTFVLFTSDNGGTKRGSNAPLRGFKGSTWEGGIRVCTIAWWPGRIPAGTRTDIVSGMFDILPTLVSFAGGKVPADRKLDGQDIGPALLGRPGAKGHEVFYYYRGLKLEAVRSGPWKLHLAQGLLYDLDKDPGESENVAKDHPDQVSRLRGYVDRMKDDLGLDGKGPGCRKLGEVADARPLIDHDGTPREGFGSGKK